MAIWIRRFGARRGHSGRAHLLSRYELDLPYSSVHEVAVTTCGDRIRRFNAMLEFESKQAPSDACRRCVPST